MELACPFIFLSIAGCFAPIVSDAQNWKGVMLPKKMVDEGWWVFTYAKKYPPIITYAFSILYGIQVPSSESSKIAKGNPPFPKIFELLTGRCWTLQTLPRLQPLTVCLDQPPSYTMSRFGTLAIYEWISFFNILFNKKLGGGFKHFLCSPLFGEMIPFDEHIFQMGWFNHQLFFSITNVSSNSYECFRK